MASRGDKCLSATGVENKVTVISKPTDSEDYNPQAVQEKEEII